MLSLPTLSILFATSPGGRIILGKDMPHDLKPYWCTSMAQAQSLLFRRHDLIVCCTLFDSSRMFDLLRYCKSHPRICTTPIVCIKAGGAAFDEIASQGIGIACKALGAVGFMDLDRLNDTLGCERAREETNKIFNELADTGYRQHSYEYRVLH